MRMKGFLLAAGLSLALLAVGLSSCTSSPATITNQQEGISVSGEGKVTVVPDVATVNLGVEAEDTNVAAARSQAASAMEKIMAALADNGVAEEDIQTQYFNIYDITRWDPETQEEITTGYRVSNVVSAKIRDMEKVGAIIDAVTLAGGDLTRVNGINFSVDDPAAFHEEAREEAMADAKARAEHLAELAGVKLGKPVYITESSYLPGFSYISGIRLDEAQEAETPISPGETEITLNVQVTYSIQ